MKNNRPEKTKSTMPIVKNHYYITIESAGERTAGSGERLLESIVSASRTRKKRLY